MKKKPSPRGRNAGTRNRRAKPRVLSRLSPDESAEVLRLILAAHPELAKEAEALAESLLKGASFESIADEVVYEISSLDVEDVLEGSGRHSRGYVDPGEAASNNLFKVIQPYIDNITRCLELGIEDEALEICKGVVLGLYRL